jgi:hypothetical protein
MSWQYVEEIRAALRTLQAPLVQGLMAAQNKVRERAAKGLVHNSGWRVPRVRQ